MTQGDIQISIKFKTNSIVYTGFVRAARLPAWNLLTNGLTGFDMKLSGWGEHGKYWDSQFQVFHYE